MSVIDSCDVTSRVDSNPVLIPFWKVQQQDDWLTWKQMIKYVLCI